MKKYLLFFIPILALSEFTMSQKLITFKTKIFVKRSLSILVLLLLTTLAEAQVSITIDVTEPGTLSALVTDPATVTNLTVTGTIDATDVKFMRDEMTLLGEIDLSAVTIAEYTGTDGTAGPDEITYPMNTMPDNSFYDAANDISKDIYNIVLPSNLTSIGSSAFERCGFLESIAIPANVTSIGSYAFGFCTSFTTFTIPASVTSIGNGAFSYSGITTITIPDNVTSIGSYAFYHCTGLTIITIPVGITSLEESVFNECSGLTSVTIPNNITSIGWSAFANCSGLTSVTIPSSVTSIGFYAFQGCTSMASIYAYSTTPVDIASSVDVFSGINKSTCHLYVPVGSKSLYRAAVQWGDFTNILEAFATVNVSTPGTLSMLLTDPTTVTKLTLTGTIDARDVKFMRDNMTVLADVDLSAVTIVEYTGTLGTRGSGSDSFTYPVNTMPDFSFYHEGTIGKYSLTNIALPSTLTSIAIYAFAHCTGLTSISIPDNVTSIADYAFVFCNNLTSITIPAATTHISSVSFMGCTKLTSIDVNASNSNYSSIGGVLFNTDKTTLICFPGVIGNYAIPASVTRIGFAAFLQCAGLTSLAIPVTVNNIDSWAFWGCTGLTSINIPSSVTSIGGNTFADCTSLSSITIPAGITSIEGQAFQNCTSLTSIYANRSTPVDLTSSVDVFSGINTTTCLLYVPVGSKILYELADQWKEFTHIVEINNTVNVTIPGTLSTLLTPDQIATLTKLTLTGTIDARDVKFMRDEMTALADLDLSAVTIAEYTGTEGTRNSGSWLYPANILPTSSFYNGSTNTGKTTLTNIILPLSITTIGDEAFGSCTGLTSITIPDHVTDIWGYAFHNCTNLTSITIPASATNIASLSFVNCTSLTSIAIDPSNNNYISIGGVLFNKDKTTLICYPSVSGNYAIPASVTTIDFAAFYLCTRLTSLTIPVTVNNISSGAFWGCSGLTSINIPSSVTSIGWYTFAECSSLSSITIPAGVTSIGNHAFVGCTNMTSIYAYPVTPVDLTSPDDVEVFLGIDKNKCILNVPIGSESAYSSAVQWGDFVHILGINPRYVTPNGAGSFDGTSWANAYDSNHLQTAISETGVTEVWVVAGTYYPTNNGNQLISFNMKTGVAIYGGFAGTETMRDERNWTTHPTILSGDIGTAGDNEDNSYHVVYNSGIDNTAVLDGFTIQGGSAFGPNSIDKSGAGMYNSISSPKLVNCTISDNSSDRSGAGVYNANSLPTLINCLIVKNSTMFPGGGIANTNSSNTMLTNCTISGNSAFGGGGGIFNATSSSLTINNSIIRGNSSPGTGKGIANDNGTVILNYTCHETDDAGVITINSGCITGNPLFINAGNGDYRISANSPCADAGNDTYNNETTDIRGPGFGRKLSKSNAAAIGTIDMGAYEYKKGTDPDPVMQIIYVDASKTSGSNTGTSWVNAYTSLQTTLTNAASYSEIWVAAGTYKPTTGTDRTISFQMKNDVTIYGGFAGTETLRSERNWSTHPTILSGDIGTPEINDNSYHVINNSGINNTAVLDGFTIQGGVGSSGGGMNNSLSSPTLANCTISGNYADYFGGGVSNNQSSPTFTNCIISGNSATGSGFTPGWGGGMFNSDHSNPTLTNCTISGNNSGYGGGIANYESCSPNVYNSIIWGNLGFPGNQIYNFNSATSLYSTCYANGPSDVVIGPTSTITPDANCINTSPLFVNAAGSDYHIFGNSPCVNTGNNGYNTTTYDVRAQARIQNTTIDMGAYEWTSGVDPSGEASFTWTGTNSTDWNTPGNWNPTTVPSSGSIIIIPDVTNDPVVSNLTISSIGVLTINPGGALTVSSALTNNGSLSIQSDASVTGSLITTSSSGTGVNNSQLYMTANKWHLVSPTAAGGSISSFIQNVSNAIPSKNVSGTMNYGMMDYYETGNNWNSFYTAASVDNLLSGKGYSLRRSSDGVVTFTGSLTSGTKTVALTKGGADGWNCIGNPYPSAINMNTAANGTNNFLVTNSGSLDASYACLYVWDDAFASYKILGNVDYPSRNLGQNVFQSGQGFFVKAKTGSSSVQFTTAMQAHQPNMPLKSGNSSWPGFELTAVTGQVKASTVIVFNSKMTKGLDPTYDAGLFRGSSGLNLYTRLVNDNGIDFAIQCLPDYDYSSMIIPVGIDSKTGGDVVFSVQTTNLSTDCKVIMEDKANKTFTDLSINDYKTSIAPSSSISNRFFIHTSNQTTGIIDGTLADKLSAYAIRNTEIRVKGNVSKLAVATLYDIQGRVVLIKNLEEGSLNIIPTPNLKTGIYMLIVKDNNKVQGFKLPMKE